MKVLIIEDEINAYHYLQKLLLDLREEVKILAHLVGVEESMNWLSKNEDPDLIFMDIQLSDGLSFEIFKHLDVHVPIIFTTAFDQYAIDAFKVNSIDYLLKPVHRDDLSQALDKFDQQTVFFSEQQSAQLKSVLSKLGQQPKKNRCLVKKGDHFQFINVKDIAFANSSDSLTFLHTFDGKKHLYNSSMDAFFQTLDENVFFQINRSQVVNINAIEKIHPFFNSRMKIDLMAQVKDLEFIVTRSNLTKFKGWIDS